jgi:hypothetical protein
LKKGADSAPFLRVSVTMSPVCRRYSGWGSARCACEKDSKNVHSATGAIHLHRSNGPIHKKRADIALFLRVSVTMSPVYRRFSGWESARCACVHSAKGAIHLHRPKGPIHTKGAYRAPFVIVDICPQKSIL